MDHWNIFMMGREEDDLGEMGLSSLVSTAHQSRWNKT